MIMQCRSLSLLRCKTVFSKSAELYDKIYFEFKDYESEARKISELITREHPSARTLLDVACGTGEHARVLRDPYAHSETGAEMNLSRRDLLKLGAGAAALCPRSGTLVPMRAGVSR